jgi:cell division protein FtsB
MSTQDPSAQPVSELSRFGRRLLSASLFLVVCALAIHALVGDRGLVAKMRAREEYRQLSADLERLRSDNARMREDIRGLREDPSIIEEMARRDLGLMSPGETLFIIRDIPQPDPQLPAGRD